MELHPEVGGTLFSMTENVEIRDSVFKGNMGYLGGAIFFDCKKENPSAVLLIKGCFFSQNNGSE